MDADKTDIVPDISVPKHRVKDDTDQSLKSLNKMIFDENSTPKQLAIEVYPLSKNRNATAWDDLNKFGQELDQRFFKGISKKAITGGIIAACFGAIVPHPSTGYILYRTGNFLDVPISSVESGLLIGWLTVTTTPAFAQQSFNIGKRIISCIFHENPFEVKEKEDYSKPYIFKKDNLHHLANFMLFGSAVINAAIPTILMREAETDFPLFFSITAFPFYFAWAENYFRSGYDSIHHLFEFYKYAPKSNYQKREILKQRIMDFQKSIYGSDNLADKAFQVINNQKKRSFPNSDGDAFAFSALFMRTLARMQGDPETGDIREAFLTNFKLDVDTHQSSFADDIFSWASTFLTGAGIYTRYCINEAILERLLVEFGMSSEAAMSTSASLAAFEATYRVFTSHYVQRRYFQSFKDTFTLRGSFPFIRKGAGVVSFVNGALFSLPNLIAGLTVFKDYSLTSKIAYLAPSFLLDHAYHNAFFDSEYNKFITNIFTLKSKDIGTNLKRAHLNSYAEKAYRLMDVFDTETIEQLYTVLQKGL